MARAVEPYSAWFTGRKRFQTTTRAVLPVFEAQGGRIRVNPLADWTTAELAAYMARHRLRENPLVAYGYFSIGCFPCTKAVEPGEDARSGRWAGQAKTECGIHLAALETARPAAAL
jgi:phosphoadenosine phosphosulfate reductase